MCRYAEAHQVQQQAQELEIQEREKYMKERQKKIIASEAKLIQKQQNESCKKANHERNALWGGGEMDGADGKQQ